MKCEFYASFFKAGVILRLLYRRKLQAKEEKNKILNIYLIKFKPILHLYF